MKHHELVARLATSNISTKDFRYLTTVLMEIKTCENCKLLQHIVIKDYNAYKCRAGFNPECGGCNKWEKKDDSTYIDITDGKEKTKWGM